MADNAKPPAQQRPQSRVAARGFAAMDPARQRQIAAAGGRAAHAAGTAHEFTSQEGREAGRMSHKNDGKRQNGNLQSGTGQGNRGSHTNKR